MEKLYIKNRSVDGKSAVSKQRGGVTMEGRARVSITLYEYSKTKSHVCGTGEQLKACL